MAVHNKNGAMRELTAPPFLLYQRYILRKIHGAKRCYLIDFFGAQMYNDYRKSMSECELSYHENYA